MAEKQLGEEELMQDDVDDALMMDDFKENGAKFSTVEATDISTLMRKVVYSTHRVPNTTTIVATATLKLGEHNFTLVHQHTACTDPRNFNEEKGINYAILKASKAAREKLWELEGYLMFKQLSSAQEGE